MASIYNVEKNAYEMAIQPYVGKLENQQGFANDCQWSKEYDCAIVNGVLAPLPLSVVPLQSEAHFEEKSESSGAKSRKRPRQREGTRELSFRLFKFLNAGEQYVLETYQVKTGSIDRFHLIVNKEKNGWKVKSHDLAKTNHILCPILEDPNPPIFHKRCEFTLQERLIGWTIEYRKRSSGREDTFYYHRGKQFRSFAEMASFVLYSSKQKDLKHQSDTE